MKKVKIFLATSILLNIFFIGGSLILFKMNQTILNNIPLIRFENSIQSLPEQSRKTVEDIWNKRNSNIKQSVNDMFLSMTELRKILTASRFDNEKFQELTEKLNAKESTLKFEIFLIFQEIAQSVPSEDRVEFFENTLPDEIPERISKRLK